MKKFIFIFLIIFTVGLGLSLAFFLNKKVHQDIEPEIIQSNQEIEEPEEIKYPTEHPDSIRIMSEKEYHGSDLKLEKVLEKNEAYTRYAITYQSEGLQISGIMNIPHGDGPFSVLILNHGYIDPKIYTTGQGLKREQDFFARSGYIVLHSDYRDHADSDFDPKNEIRPRAGYTEDVINAIGALKNSDIPNIDKENIGMLGHSMGGGVTLNIMVTKPTIAKAYALLAPIHSDYKINFNTWVRSDWSATAQEFINLYGEPEENPELWDSISAKNYLDKVSSPILLHQGVLDNQVPVAWSRELTDILKEKNKDITYYEYPQENHVFINAQNLVMQKTLEFFDENLK